MTTGDSPPEAKTLPPAPTGSVKIAAGLLVATVIAFTATLHFRRAPDGHGDLSAVRVVEERLRAQHRARWANEIVAERAKDPCSGAERAAARGLDANLATEVLSLLAQSAKHCPRLASPRGLRAEALMRAGQMQAGEREAAEVLAIAPRDPHALYAQALGAWRKNRGSDALTLAERAVEAGRAASAYLLKGLIAYGSNQLDLAEASFKSLLELEPDDVEGVYDLALVDQQRDRYGRAREGYLRVLRLDPTRADARYNLGILAHSIGANDEAKHHLAKLRALPADPAQIAKLEAILAVPVETAHPGAAPPAPALSAAVPP